MNKFKFFLISTLCMLCLITCKQFLKDLDEDFSYWAANVYVKKTDISKLHLDKEGYPYLLSENNRTISLEIFNDKNHKIREAVDSSSNKDIVVFEKGVLGSDGTNPPRAGVDYTLKQINQNTLELNLSKAFLEKSECGIQNLSPTITLYNKEGRKFEQKYTFKLRANTPPPALEYKALCKTQGADGKKYYVLCFEVKDMDKRVSAGLLHKDIAALSSAAAGGAKNTLPLTVEGNGFKIDNSGGLLLAYEKTEALASNELDSGSPNEIPKGPWIIYFKTDVEVRGAAKEYTFKLIDQKGLSSAEERASTSTNKLPDVTLYYGSFRISADKEANPYPINTGSSGSGVSLQARAKEGAALSGTVEKKDSDSWIKTSDVSGKTEASISLSALQAGENEALYKISLRSSGTGYSDSGLKVFFVKLTKDIVINFSVGGGKGSLKGIYGTT